MLANGLGGVAALTGMGFRVWGLARHQVRRFFSFDVVKEQMVKKRDTTSHGKAPATSFRDLRVWKDGIALVTEVYSATSSFPRNELFGLTRQMQRAAVSIPSNIAEGYARQHRKEYLQFLAIAQGSLAELETQLEIAFQLEYLDFDRLILVRRKSNRLGKQLRSLRTSLN